MSFLNSDIRFKFSLNTEITHNLQSGTNAYKKAGELSFPGLESFNNPLCIKGYSSLDFNICLMSSESIVCVFYKLMLNTSTLQVYMIIIFTLTFWLVIEF